MAGLAVKSWPAAFFSSFRLSLQVTVLIGRPMIAFSLIKFVLATLPTFLKVAEWVIAAGKELAGKTGEEKRAWVMEKLKVELPKSDTDSLYNWINSVVYLLRNMGKPT